MAVALANRRVISGFCFGGSLLVKVSDWLSVLYAPPTKVLGVAPDNGFAKVHYGFILKSENKIAESIPYLKVSTHIFMFVCTCGDLQHVLSPT